MWKTILGSVILAASFSPLLHAGGIWYEIPLSGWEGNGEELTVYERHLAREETGWGCLSTLDYRYDIYQFLRPLGRRN